MRKRFRRRREMQAETTVTCIKAIAWRLEVFGFGCVLEKDKQALTVLDDAPDMGSRMATRFVGWF